MQTFSEKVLARKRARRENRNRWVFTSILLAYMVVMGAYLAWHEHKRNQPDWYTHAFVGADLDEHIVFKRPDLQVPMHAMIDGQRWDFIQVDHFDDTTKDKVGNVMAETDCENQEISYLRSEDGAQLRENIMHEIYHAGACRHKEGDAWWNSINPTDKEHPGVYHLGEFGHNFLHDNRQFADWLAEE